MIEFSDQSRPRSKEGKEKNTSQSISALMKIEN